MERCISPVRRYSSCLALLAVVLVALFVPEEARAQNPCAGKVTCSDCIRTPACSWCSQKGLDDAKRCFRSDFPTLCSPAEVHNPSTFSKTTQEEQLTVDEQKEFIATGENEVGTEKGRLRRSTQKIVQLSPQRVTLKLRINKAHRINISYAQAEDYPIDLYYLMDLSQSMKDDKERLSTLGQNLVDTMRKITSKFRLGFGSFVDKLVLPFVATTPEQLLHPCSGCAAPYGYRNHMSLNNNTDDFVNQVKSAPMSGNVDAPEGGFDAVMQAIVCSEQIGWRQQARRLLVFSTDAPFHYAGDGKLGGIVKPNDGECHLDASGLYTHSTLQDYPSVSQINLKAVKHSVNIIFAVTEEHINIYKQLQKWIEGSSAALLSTDSSNVVTLVEEEYKKISSSVELRENASSALLQVRYFTRGIEGQEQSVHESNSYKGLKVGSKVNFEVEFFASRCPADPKDWKQTIEIKPVGLNESLIVDLELLCNCDCEKEGHAEFERSSSACNEGGDFACGVCLCDDEHFGRFCECDSKGEGPQLEKEQQCRMPNVSQDCSGRGACVCGQCLCHPQSNPQQKVWGVYCECDNFSCPYHGGEICSGPQQGECSCGICECVEGWEGKACECSTSTSSCLAPASNELCSGKGSCECGKCTCDTVDEDTDQRFIGQFCERIPVANSRCTEFDDCVLCSIHKRGPISEELCPIHCGNFTFITVPYVEANEDEGEIPCIHYDEGCRYKFVYLLNVTDVVIRAQEDLECTLQGNFMGLIGGVIAVVVLIGLAILLCWKLVTSVKDKREYEKFENETRKAKWESGVNPLYKEAVSKYSNPTYSNVGN